MEVTFRSRRLQRIFSSESELQREYGSGMARSIPLRLAALDGASNLTPSLGGFGLRLHLLTGRRGGQFGIDLIHAFRPIIIPNHDPIPISDDGGVDTTRVTAITILEVVDYH